LPPPHPELWTRCTWPNVVKRALKHLKSFYHGFAEPLLRGYFPGLPCYEHFVALQKSVFVPLVVFLVSHLGTRTGIY
jgi:hypothetical protein